MNSQLENYARQELKTGLSLLPESHQHMFKRMYSSQNLDANIIDVINSMTVDTLDIAMQQVQRSLEKLEKT